MSGRLDLSNRSAALQGWVAFSVLVGLSVLIHLLPSQNTLDLPLRVISALKVVENHKVPFREVNVLYGPAGHYVLGWFIKLTGISPMVAAQMFFLACSIGSLLALKGLLSSAAPRIHLPVVLLGFASLGMLIIWFSFYTGFAFLVLLLSCLAARRALSRGEPRATVYLVLLGLLTAIGLLNRINFGAFVFFATGATMVVTTIRSGLAELKRAAMYGGVVAVTFLIGAVLTVGIDLEMSYLRTVLGYVARFESRMLPLAAQSPWEVVPVIAVFLLQVILTIRLVVRGARPYQIYLSLLTLAFFSYAVARLDAYHYYTFLVMGLVTSTVVLDEAEESPVAGWVGLAGASLVAAAALPHVESVLTLPVSDFNYAGVMGGVLTFLDSPAGELLTVVFAGVLVVRGLRAVLPRIKAGKRLEAGLCILSIWAITYMGFSASVTYLTGPVYFLTKPPRLEADGDTHWLGMVVRGGFLVEQAEANLLDYLDVRMKPEDDVFYGNVPGDCECPVDWCAKLNFYLIQNRVPVGKYWFFDPPSSTDPVIQQQMVRALEAERVKFVVLQRRQGPKTPCIVPDLPAEADVFYRSVLDNYVPVKLFCAKRECYRVFERREREGED